MEKAPVLYDPVQGWERMEQKILNHQRAARRRKAGIWTVAGVMAAAAAVWLFTVILTDESHAFRHLTPYFTLQSHAPQIITVVTAPQSLLAEIPFTKRQDVNEQERSEEVKAEAADTVAATRFSMDRDPIHNAVAHKETRRNQDVFLLEDGPRPETQRKRVTLSASGLVALQDKNSMTAVKQENFYVLREKALSYATTERAYTAGYGGESVFIASDFHSYEYKHKFPISFGIYASLSLGEKWAVESGIRASRLLSGVYTVSGPQAVPVYVSDQVLWYVGLPLRIRWDFIRNRYVTAYTSVGGTVDKCFSFTYTKAFEPTDLRFDASDIPLQWSVNAAIGIQYNIIQTVGLFAEPGIAYFFDNGSPIGTFWQEKSLNFQLNAGIRFSF